MLRDRRPRRMSEHRLEVLATVLLAVAAVATAWASYQASRWRGEQAIEFARANATRLESNRVAGVANRQVQVDVATFIQWVDAYATGEDELEAFYRRRFRPEFKPAVEAWIATKPLQNHAAPLTPFAMPQYRLASNEQVDKLDREAAALSTTAGVDIDRADRYMLSVVLFASALFFAGISTRLHTPRGREVILGLGWLVFLGALVWLATFPVSFST